jgi:hypothetical protein
MNDHDTGVLDTLRDALDGVTMSTPVEQIVSTGRTRRNHRLVATVAAGTVAVAGLALGVATLANPSAAPPTTGQDVHIRTVAYSVDKLANGTVQVTWTKRQYIDDPAGLEAALRQAGFPVLIKVGEFCVGPQDDPTLVRGTGPGVEDVVGRVSDDDGEATFIFNPAAMPAGKQLFIGYLNAAQLEVTGGTPGSVERLVSIDGPLACTTQAPPADRDPGKEGDKNVKMPGAQRPGKSGDPSGQVPQNK